MIGPVEKEWFPECQAGETQQLEICRLLCESGISVELLPQLFAECYDILVPTGYSAYKGTKDNPYPFKKGGDGDG